jgi:glycosyltransferase involved in cell wall biosynthesis
MRVALVHSYYRSETPSGENVAVDRQAELLAAAGHEVQIVARHSDEDAARSSDKLRLAWQVARGTGPDPSAELRAFNPDIVHVHNLFPNFGTRWLKAWQGPLVATVHNYRPLCANALLLREGKFCTLCPDGDKWAGVRHSCYRGSRVATIPLAIRNRSGVSHDALLQRANRVIMLSPRAESIYRRYGLPAEKLRQLPHGIDTATTGDSLESVDRWVSVGRLTSEKGWAWLVANWPADIGLDIFGAGPMRTELAAAAPASVRLLGEVSNDVLRAQLPRYQGAVFAGVAPEGCPFSAIEALAAGLPLIARQDGAAADMVERWGCGSIFRDGYEMSRRLHQPTTPADRQTALHTFRDNFTTEAWLSGLLVIYRELVTS